ncbi:MAG: formate dehydrogenase subunit alpha, partial [Rhodobacteraceae bacterium]|nr:formate dehydrogenase subunit alpha [Paracoccaceae bacterium]
NWDYTHPSEIFAEMKLTMQSLDNITWQRLEEQNSVTYPCESPEDPGQSIVFGDGFPTSDGLANFTPASIIPPDELPDDEFPMILITGRQLEHWHTGSMTRRSRILDSMEPEAVCSLHPSTLRNLGVEAGGNVRLETRRGTIHIKAREDRNIPVNSVFVPFAFVEAAGNVLTNPAIDPYGKIPEFKFSAVKIDVPVELEV